MDNLEVTINGKPFEGGYRALDELERAVIISLFSWRRADPTDVPEGSEKYGWWGDTFPVVENDQYGSKLWLLTREIVTTEVMNRAKQYIEEALEWMIADGIAQVVTVGVQRFGRWGITADIKIYKPQETLDYRLSAVWEKVNAN